MNRFILAFVALCLSPPLRAQDAARGFRIPTLYHVGYWVRDAAKARDFYEKYLGFEEPYVLNHADGTLQMVVIKVNERQVIYLFPDSSRIKPNGDNLDHLGLLVDNVAALHDTLIARGLKVGAPHLGHIGDLLMGVFDPDGHGFEATQLEPQGQLLRHQGKSLPATRIASHLRSATVVTSDLAASVAFYRDKLGFKEVGTVGATTRLHAIVHLLAMARRAGVPLAMDSFDRIAAGIPLLANIKPSGTYLMEDFYYAGGLRALLAQLAPRLRLDAITVTGGTLGEAIAGAAIYNDDVIRALDRPVKGAGGTAVLRGSLAPDGAVIKPTAAEERLLVHEGPAVVFSDIVDLKARIDRDDLDVTADPFSCCGTPARSARRECRNGGNCRFRKNCCARACATWSASPTRG